MEKSMMMKTAMVERTVLTVSVMMDMNPLLHYLLIVNQSAETESLMVILKLVMVVVDAATALVSLDGNQPNQCLSIANLSAETES